MELHAGPLISCFTFGWFIYSPMSWNFWVNRWFKMVGGLGGFECSNDCNAISSPLNIDFHLLSHVRWYNFPSPINLTFKSIVIWRSFLSLVIEFWFNLVIVIGNGRFLNWPCTYLELFSYSLKHCNHCKVILSPLSELEIAFQSPKNTSKE